MGIVQIVDSLNFFFYIYCQKKGVPLIHKTYSGGL